MQYPASSFELTSLRIVPAVAASVIKVTDQRVHLMLGLGELIVGVEQDGEFGSMRPAVTMPGSFTLYVREGRQHRL